MLLSLQLFGCGSVAQVTTSQNTKGEYLSINLGFALGTTFGIYVAKGVSGIKSLKQLWILRHKSLYIHVNEYISHLFKELT